MNPLDIILLICFLPAVIRGLSKGFLEQAICLVGLFVSVWAAFRFSELVCGSSRIWKYRKPSCT